MHVLRRPSDDDRNKQPIPREIVRALAPGACKTCLHNLRVQGRFDGMAGYVGRPLKERLCRRCGLDVYDTWKAVRVWYLNNLFTYVEPHIRRRFGAVKEAARKLVEAETTNGETT